MLFIPHTHLGNVCLIEHDVGIHPRHDNPSKLRGIVLNDFTLQVWSETLPTATLTT